MVTTKTDTVVVGGGQAGLAVSYYLSRQSHGHIVLEQSDSAAAMWRNRSWDSFTLVTPNWAFKMSGANNNGVERRTISDFGLLGWLLAHVNAE